MVMYNYQSVSDIQYWAKSSLIKDVLLDVKLTAKQKVRLLCTEAVKDIAIAMLDKWFQGIESGRANQWFPSPKCTISQQEADKFIDDLDDEISSELIASNLHWASRAIDLPADFSRLKPVQRIAMLEEYRGAVIEEIKKVHSSVFIGCLHACPTEFEDKLRQVFAEGIQDIDHW